MATGRRALRLQPSGGSAGVDFRHRPPDAQNPCALPPLRPGIVHSGHVRIVGVTTGLIVGWFVGGIAYLAVDGLADRAGMDLSTTVVGLVLAAAGAATGGLLGYRRSQGSPTP